VAEGIVMVTEKRAIQHRAKDKKRDEGNDNALTAQDARVRTAEAKMQRRKPLLLR